MTKKPSEKNKAWEKDRRDRLNKTFDELAKLLPKYDASVVWSKIEIIQKAITFIESLQKKQADYLKSNDPELLKEYEEFVNCLKFYQERNAQLTELLKKAKVTLPPVVLPQLLVEKPELQPKAEDVEAVCLQKPKRQRNRTKKSDAGVKSSAGNVEKEEAAPKVAEVASEKGRSSPLRSAVVSQVEIVTKPTAIITAFSRETLNEAPIIVPVPPPQPQPPVPVKPLLVRLQRAKSNRRLKRKAIFRKCYPHPNRIHHLNADARSHRKLPSKQRRSTKRKQLQKVKPSKRLKLLITPEPIREQSVSPTAAFLLSFPVVTSSMLSGKNVENAENSVSLENLNNFFTTEEYSKFCDQNTVGEDKIATPICAPLPIERTVKSQISGKPMTSFTVSAITRPSSPKKPVGQCDQTTNKRLSDAPWIAENKSSRTTSNTSFESGYHFTNMNPMIGSTSICQTPLTSTTHQVTSSQCSATKTLPAACIPSIASDVKATPKLETAPVKLAPIYLLQTPNTSPKTNAASKRPNTTQNPPPTQKGALRTDIPITPNWTVKPTTVVATNSPSDGCISKPLNGKPSSNIISKIPPGDSMTKTASKPSASSYFSPTKSFFYDLPPQNQPITTFNLNTTATTSSSSADPLISSTPAAKSHSFLGFPSIKTEFPWIPPNTTSFTMPLATTTPTTTSISTCNLNTNYTSFDLASIVSESLTSTSFAYSLTTPKSSEPTVVETGNKQNNKCNQMNLFLPYEETQYTPTFSVTKPTDNQIYPTARESPWKSEKTKDITDQIFYDCEQSKPTQKSHVNWMTTPATDYTSAPAVPPLPPIDFGNQFPSSTNFDFGFSCRKDSYDDDNQFINWSPTKPLSADFSTAYSFENFGSNEAPPNKTVKQIFSVSQLVEQTPPESTPMKKSLPKTPAQKSTPVKQTFSNTYTAESLIAKKDNHRMTNTTTFYNANNTDAANTQSDYHNPSNYFYNYSNTQSCLQSENDYLGAGTYSASSTLKTTSILPPTAGTSTAPVIPPFDSSPASSTTNYFAHSISSNANDPYDPTYFPSSNYNHPTAANWNHKGPPANGYNQNQLPLAVGYSAVEPSCQQNANVSGNLTNFNLSSICPEIDGKDGASGW